MSEYTVSARQEMQLSTMQPEAVGRDMLAIYVLGMTGDLPTRLVMMERVMYDIESRHKHYVQ